MKLVLYSLAAVLPLALSTQADNLWEQVSCFTSVGNMENMGTFEFQSVDHCIAQCDEVNGVFAAVQEESCYCGTAALDIQDMALADDESACNASCPGYAVDTCGGDGVYSLWVSQEYFLSLGDDDDDDDDDNDDNDNDNNDDNKGYDYGDEDGGSDGDENEDGEDSDSHYSSGWNNTSTAVATTTVASTSATNPVSTSVSVSGLASSLPASTSQTATGSAAITTTTSTSGASRRFRILFF